MLILNYIFVTLGIIFFVMFCMLSIIGIIIKAKGLKWFIDFKFKSLWCKYIHRNIKPIKEHYMSPFDVGNGYRYYLKCEKCNNKWKSDKAIELYENANETKEINNDK